MKDLKTVRKGNKVLKVDSLQLESFLKDGFDEIDENGKIVSLSPNKSYSAGEIEKLRAADKTEIAALKKQIAALKKKSAKPRE